MNKLMTRQGFNKDLPIFTGDPEEWLMFITQYRHTTEVCGYQDYENLVRLEKCLKGKAREAVLPILNIPANVSDVIKTLEKTFGQSEHIVINLISKAKSTPAPKKGKPETLISFANSVRNMVRTLETLKFYDDLRNPQLLRELAGRLPNGLQLEWCDISSSLPGGVDLTIFTTWLDDKSRVANAQALLRLANSIYGNDRDHQRDRDKHCDKKTEKREDAFHVFTLGEGKSKDKSRDCPLCTKVSHRLDHCSTFLSYDINKKWDVAKENNCCFNCLIPGHPSNKCKRDKVCELPNCKRRHHTLLHKADPEVVTQGLIVHVSDDSTTSNKVLLRIIPVRLCGPAGDIHTYAMLDEGSTMTLIESNLADQLGLRGPEQALCMQWTHDVIRNNPKSRRVTVGISGVQRGAKQFRMSNVRTVADMHLPPQSIDMEQMSIQWPYLRNIPFSSLQNARPRIIIGQDNYLLTTPRNVVHHTWTAPIATRTWLGWVVYGASPAHNKIDTGYAFHICNEPDVDLQVIHNLVKESFSIENLGVKITNPNSRSKEDMRALSILEKTTRRVGDRWETGLLWRSDQIITPDSKPTALRRLACLEKRMDQDPKFAANYIAKMQDLIDKGYVRKLTREDTAVRRPHEWYFPHFGVVNPNKEGVRMVFDAAAKSRGISYNDYMLTGPDLLLSIVAVLWRFREFQFAFASDIKEMFLRVLIPEEEIHSQRFFWRGMNRSISPEVYAVSVVCFGGTMSPCSANYVKIRNAEEFKEEFPKVHEMVLLQSYMDDFLGGADTETEATKLIFYLIEVHRRGGFNLCNWTSNSKEILKQIPTDLKSKSVKDLSPEAEIPIERVLGMHWNPQSDTFTYKLNFHKVAPEVKTGHRMPTKREVLQLVMSVYDPLGFLCFFTIRAKILLQDIWKTNIGWDDKLTGEYGQRWLQWVTDLQHLTDISIPRCISRNLKRAESVDLHMFCDASDKAYAAVAYLRIVHSNGVDVFLIGAKARVAPLKHHSVPRLELQSCLLAARLSASIRKEHKLLISRLVLWGDSMAALGWLRNTTRRLPQYVANRVGEILELTDAADWRWIGTKANVADDATRDVGQHDFSNSTRWFQGPSFLLLPEKDWPQEENKLEKVKDGPEMILLATENDDFPNAKDFSSWTRLIRVTAWMLRWAANSKKENKEKLPRYLTVEELKKAELMWLLRAQRQSFPREVLDLQKQKKVDSMSALLKLSPALDERGLIILKGRTENATTLSEETKRPVILDPNHSYTKLIVRHFHEKMHHQGHEGIVNELRQCFWILRMRQAVQSSFRNCQICKNKNVKPSSPEMGQLPQFRFVKKIRPFSYCGLDFFGPLWIRNGQRREKRYGVIFTCMSIRAVHLELAKSLKTDSTLNAIRRFVSRRGQPKEIYSDNATNFEGASKELREAIKSLDQDALHTAISGLSIKWKFNPPAAPHMGGSWESLIKSVKAALRHSLKGIIPSEDVLDTFLAETENIVNSRPLTHVSVDPSDSESLTPNHFILGSSSGAPSPGKFSMDGKCLKMQWRISQVLTDCFWKRWVKEFLPTLTRRTKWFTPTTPLKIGDVVIIADHNGPRNSWPLGRICNVYPGKDGQVRVVDVKTKNGIFRRPVANLCKLDIDGNETE